MGIRWNVGVDVGSTTVKAVVMDRAGAVHWKKYRRHNTQQAEAVLSFMAEIQAEFGDGIRVYVTGSGSRPLAPLLNGEYIQEVNAVTYAVERLCPDTGSVIELGGQDAKVIIWSRDDAGRRTTQSYMNDKCAGGTGATIDKILGKIGISHEEAGAVDPEGKTVHAIAAKCGVFAETDIVGLLKSGVDRDELVVSLLTAIARQNLEVLVRGNVLKDRVLLLGGPHTYFSNFASIWRKEIPAAWAIQGWQPGRRPRQELVYVPNDSEYFAAIGAVLYGMESEQMRTRMVDSVVPAMYSGPGELEHYVAEGRILQLMASGAVSEGLAASDEEVAAFARDYVVPDFDPPVLALGQEIRAFIGIDGGSTSSKLALVDDEAQVIYRDYVLSNGNPIDDVREMFRRMEEWVAAQGIALTVAGTAITGYASPILQEAFSLDVAVVETVAHMRSAAHYYGEVDIICDIGGQDIKVLFMKNGRVVDFKLNTQCSAGNGYFLQGMAEQFGIPIDQYAEHAFRAKRAPAFNYGCAVFMEQDRVNFQQLGWTKEEIMAGLALVLPLNIWNYVVQEPNIAKFGRRVVLQGGTQKNLAAAKAQVDFIHSKVPDAQVMVHKYADICGAIGAAIECREQLAGKQSTFVGIATAAQMTFESHCDDSTRCRFCKNRCPRTFVDICLAPGHDVRFISGWSCEKGRFESAEEMRADSHRRAMTQDRFPNLVEHAAATVFEEYDFQPFPPDGTTGCEMIGETLAAKRRWGKKVRRFRRSSADSQRRRSEMVVGIPRLLNNYLYGPFFSTYLRALGVGKIVYSDYTSKQLWEEGNKWGAIDPCFPAKVAPAHIRNLLDHDDLTHICFPIITHLESQVDNTLGNNACVIQMGTPEVVQAVFTRGKDHFADHGVEYWKPLVRMDNPVEACGLLFRYFEIPLGITEDENDWAARQGYQAMQQYFDDLRARGKKVIDDLVARNEMGIVMLGHPYHHDPGLNHGVLEELQQRGFAILCIESLPVEADFLRPLFAADQETEHGKQMDIKDIWQRNFNRNTNLKLWAAKVVARHPNLAALDLSSFKCGHDAPTYSYVDNVMDTSGTAHFSMHDIDQNKPRASLNIRLQTIDYFLRIEEARLKCRLKGYEHA